ncbi:MAG: transglutaminase domain-containing protein [Clostridia bacterium]|nr:transglutaminase domain-containing protein [Clostridia bacterium]
MNSKYTDSCAEIVGKNIKKVTLALKITVCVLAALMIFLAVALIIDIVGLTIEHTLEAGDKLPSAVSLSGKSNARYEFGDYDGEFTVPGEYEFYIISGSRRFKVKLTVEDTTAPRAELLQLYVNKGGPYPSAIDFFKNVTDASEVTARFKNGVNPSELGEYDIELELSDAYGNKRNYKTKMILITDTVPPVISGPSAITGYLGEAVAYRKDIVVTDNCFGEVKLDVDTSKVNPDKAGTYKVIYTATDAAGNASTFELNLTIVAERVTYEALMEQVGTLAAQLGITKNMTKEEQVKRIYGYVNSPNLSASTANIKFFDESNTDRSDWIREAALTLRAGSGDCYSYFAVSKAFFEYFGIENRDIERSKGVTTQSGTHFWSMVNIGTAENPQWYYYDATRLKTPHASGNACLFTESQLVDYNTNKQKGFLTYDHAGYPTASTKIINTGYAW